MRITLRVVVFLVLLSGVYANASGPGPGPIPIPPVAAR